MISCCSDSAKNISSLTFKEDRMSITAKASVIAFYPGGVEKIRDMRVQQNVLYVSCSGQSSGLFSVKMLNRAFYLHLRNGEGNVKDIFDICQDQDNILFTYRSKCSSNKKGELYKRAE